MFGRKKKAQKFRMAEEYLAKYVIYKYKDVKKIVFNGWGHDAKTGFWGITMIINDTDKLSFSLSDPADMTSISSIRYNKNTFQLVSKSNEETQGLLKSIQEKKTKVDLGSIDIRYSYMGD